MSALFDVMAGSQMGNQVANTAMQGMLPSGSQPKGSPQAWIPVMGELHSEIAALNATADKIRRIGGEDANDHVLTIISCTKDLQGMITDIQKSVQEMTQPQAGQQAA